MLIIYIYNKYGQTKKNDYKIIIKIFYLNDIIFFSFIGFVKPFDDELFPLLVDDELFVEF